MYDYEKLMLDFGQALNENDVEALASMMDSDCVFYALAGNDSHGTQINGRDNIIKAFADVWGPMPDAHWESLDCFASDHHGLSRWLFTATTPNNTKIKAQGCDIFTFKDGKITSKNAFRKQCPEQSI